MSHWSSCRSVDNDGTDDDDDDYDDDDDGDDDEDYDGQGEAERQLVGANWFRGQGGTGQPPSEGRDWSVYFQVITMMIMMRRIMRWFSVWGTQEPSEGAARWWWGVDIAGGAGRGGEVDRNGNQLWKEGGEGQSRMKNGGENLGDTCRSDQIIDYLARNQ